MGVSTDAYLVYGWPVPAWHDCDYRPTGEPLELYWLIVGIAVWFTVNGRCSH